MFSKAPWSSQHDGESKEKEKEQSLTTILKTAEERSDLNRLIVTCTETMRTVISDTFDPRYAGISEASMLVLQNQDEQVTQNQETPEIAASKDLAEQEKERVVQELSSKSVQDVKRAALNYFDDWRDKVLMRVGEVINSRDEPAQAAEVEPEAPELPARPAVSRDRLAQRKVPESNTESPLVQVTEETRVSASSETATNKLHELYPPTETPLSSLPRDQRILILHSLLLLLLSLERYPAQSRILLLHVTSSLGLPIDLLTEDESKVAQGLLEVAKTYMTADAETQNKIDKNAASRKWKVGLGAVAGATLLAVTGGLAAPLLAAGIGSVMGGLGLGATAAAGYMGALAGSSVLIGGLFGAYGGRMTSKMVDKYAKEVEDFAFLPIQAHSRFRRSDKDSRRLRVAIGISGWLTEQDEIVKPWRVVGKGIEGFALRWELEALVKLGNALTTLLKSAAWGFAKKEIISRTVFASLSAGLWPLMIVKASNIIDNPFSVAKARSDKAGAVLAEVLINKCQGERPVTLVGYSLGARVIYSCLVTLAERKAFGLIESVVLLGAPAPSDPVQWRKIRSVVSGRVVNAFSTNDFILGYLYRASSLQNGIAGLQPIAGVKNIESVDVSDLVDGHLQYRYLTGSILKKIGFEDIDEEEVKIEEEELRAKERIAEAARREAESKRTKEDVDAEVREMQHEVEEKNQASMLGWVSKKMSFMNLGRSHDGEEDKLSEREKLARAEGDESVLAGGSAAPGNEQGLMAKTGNWLGGLTAGLTGEDTLSKKAHGD